MASWHRQRLGSSMPLHRTGGKKQPQEAGQLLLKNSPEERKQEIKWIEWDGKAKKFCPCFCPGTPVLENLPCTFSDKGNSTINPVKGQSSPATIGENTNRNQRVRADQAK